jgi:hypothetical protein
VVLGGGTRYFPSPGEEDQPGAGRHTDVRLSRRPCPLPARVIRLGRHADQQR